MLLEKIMEKKNKKVNDFKEYTVMIIQMKPRSYMYIIEDEISKYDRLNEKAKEERKGEDVEMREPMTNEEAEFIIQFNKKKIPAKINPREELRTITEEEDTIMEE